MCTVIRSRLWLPPDMNMKANTDLVTNFTETDVSDNATRLSHSSVSVILQLPTR